ncbi:uncharacterized protein akap12a [Eucyclogobius newberryi]|uniref:uncharacterized protein akap12a n=1 Tax=Eucyclogobius newberryi TaxID=166745 RepID=UPI003B5CB922
MGDAQSAQRDGESEAAAAEESAVERGPSGESAHDELMQNNGQISECNSKPDGTTADDNGLCEDQFAKEAVIEEDKDIPVTGSASEEVADVQEKLPDPNEEEPIKIMNIDAKQNDLNESFRRFFSNIGLKLTVKKGSADQADDEAEKEEIEKLDALEETTSNNKYEDVEQTTELNAIQDNDSTTCPTLTEGTSDDVAETVEENNTETKEIAGNAEAQDANVTVTLEQSPIHQEEGEEIVSPIKMFFTTGIFAGRKKKKMEEEAEAEDKDKELVDMSKKYADAPEDQQDIVEASLSVEKQEIECKEVQEDAEQAVEPPEFVDRGKSPSTDQDSESEITSSQEKVQSSPLKRLFSGRTFKRSSKRQKGRRSSDGTLSDSGEQIENQKSENTERQDTIVETPSPPPLMTDQEEELSAWEAFKKLMTPKKSLKRASVGSEELQVQAVAVEETKPSEGERVSDHSTEEGRKRKDSSHSWESVLCGSGRRRSRKTSDSEDEQKQDVGEGESPNEAGDVVTSMTKQASSPSDSESSTWKSFKKLMTPKRKTKDDEESRDNVQSDSEVTQEETLFSMRKLLPGRRKGKSGEKQDQLSSDEGDREVVSMEEDSETPAVVPLSEFDTSETEETAKTDVEIQDSDLESEQEHILEIHQTFVKEVQEHPVTQITASNQDQDELTDFSNYQPLSDIPEEGNITETVVTSLMEDVAKDDTLADDLVELTSEAITAPEPVDVTMADETDELMLSAASHLTESTKTSGNATPVPVEYDVKDTEVLLQEVVEIISEATKANTFCSEELALERVVSYVTHEMLERSTSEEQNVMEIQSDAVTLETGFQVDQIRDTDVDIPVTVVSESLSEFKDALSTEYVSEVSKVEFESAKIDVGEVHTVRKRAVKQESVDDSDYMIESLSEVPEYIDTVLQDENVVQDVLLVESHEGEPEEVRTESTELLLEENIEGIDLVAEQSESNDAQLITSEAPSEPELLKGEGDDTVEIDKEEEAIQEHEALMGSAETIKTVQPDQPEAVMGSAETIKTEITDKLDQEISNEKAPVEMYKVTETHVEVEIVTEDDFEFIYKQDVEDIQEPTLESQNVPEDADEEVATQEEETVPVTDLATKEEIIEDIAIEEPETDVIGENDHDIIEEQSYEVSVDVDKELVSVTEAIEQESREQPDGALLEIDISQVEDSTKLFEETFAEELKEQILPSSDQEIMEQTIDEVSTEATQQEGFEELEGTPLPEIAADEIDEKVEVLETIESQPEETNVLNQPVIISSAAECETEAMSQIDQAIDVNCDHSETKPSEAQIIQIDHCHEVAEEVGALPVEHVPSVYEVSGTAQELEHTITIEKSSEIALSSIEDPMHEVYVGEIEVNPEEQLEEEIPRPVTEVAEVKNVALQEESAITLQVTAIMPDHMIQKKVEDSDIISEETSIPCVDNAEVLDEPKHAEQLTEVEQVGIQGEKEEEIAPPETTNVDVEHTLAAQLTTCTLLDIVSQFPDVSSETTTTIHEPILGIVINEQEEQEAIEITTPLEVNNVTHVAQEGTTVALMRVPAVECEDSHQVQVQVVNTDIQSAEARVDTALEIGVQEDKGVVDSCHETVGVESFSATSNAEPEIVSEKDEVAVQEIVQHVKEIAPESEEPEYKVLPVDSVESQFSDDSESMESQVTEVTAIQDSVMETKVFTKMDEMKDVQEQASGQNHVATQDNRAVAVPQNTGIISSATQDNRAVAVPQNTGIISSATQDNRAVAVPQNTGIISSATQDNRAVAVPQNTGIISSATQDNRAVAVPQNTGIISSATQDNRAVAVPQNTGIISSATQDNRAVAVPQNTGIISSATQDNRAVAVPQNTGIISSAGNIEAPSSLSLEFKLNIQFGQSKAPTLLPQPSHFTTEQTISSPPQTLTHVVDRNEPAETSAMSEVGVQAEEKQTKLENDLQKNKVVMTEAAVQATETIQAPDLMVTVKHVELMDVGIQSTEIEEPIKEMADIDISHNKSLMDVSTQYSEIFAQNEVKTEEMVDQPVLIYVDNQSNQQKETDEEVKTIVDYISGVKTAVQPEQDIEGKGVLQTNLVVLQFSKDQGKQTEDEDENQDIWMEAEEDIDAEEQIATMPQCEIEESFGSEPDHFQETKTDFEESLENIKMNALKCDIDSEGEDFAVALEDPQTASAIATIEWD